MKIREIKRFSLKVFNAVLRLLPQLSSGSELPAKKHFKEILKSERTHFFTAELDNEQIIGMLTIVTYDIPTGTKIRIEDFVVDESQRGKGFGKELIHYAVDFAKSAGAEAIELTSRPSRTEANQLYQKSGFIKRETNVYRYPLK